MKFNPAEPKKPIREEFVSEDGCFKLTVDRSEEKHPRYSLSISVEKIEICPGFGYGSSFREAMEHSKESLQKTAATIQELIVQLDAMIADETKEPDAI